MTPHKHAKVIKAWADGATIQIKHHESGGWVDTESPQWGDLLYRVKPEVVYPVTQMNIEQITKAYNDTKHTNGLVGVANQAIKHAIDNGQVYIKGVTNE